MQDLEPLGLSPRARAAAAALQAAHPGVIFTSGRRDLPGQAHAMASNVVHNRRWIEQTYVASPARIALQAWIDANPHAVLVEALAAGLKAVMAGLAPRLLAHVSDHLTGDAFDVQPVAGPAGEAIKATIRGLPGLTRFLDHEGGLTRWHAQFV